MTARSSGVSCTSGRSRGSGRASWRRRRVDGSPGLAGIGGDGRARSAAPGQPSRAAVNGDGRAALVDPQGVGHRGGESSLKARSPAIVAASAASASTMSTSRGSRCPEGPRRRPSRRSARPRARPHTPDRTPGPARPAPRTPTRARRRRSRRPSPARRRAAPRRIRHVDRWWEPPSRCTRPGLRAVSPAIFEQGASANDALLFRGVGTGRHRRRPPARRGRAVGAPAPRR